MLPRQQSPAWKPPEITPVGSVKMGCENPRRPVLPSPVRAGDFSLLEAEQPLFIGEQPSAPSLRNCFNSGLCEWLCAHRRGLQWALGVETLALVALLAFYARLNRALAAEQAAAEDEDQVRCGPFFQLSEICGRLSQGHSWCVQRSFKERRG